MDLDSFRAFLRELLYFELTRSLDLEDANLGGLRSRRFRSFSGGEPLSVEETKVLLVERLGLSGGELLSVDETKVLLVERLQLRDCECLRSLCLTGDGDGEGNSRSQVGDLDFDRCVVLPFGSSLT